MKPLPSWPQGTPAVLCVAGPHAIPVSTFVRAGPDRVLIALGARRETLARLREEPAVALCLLGEGLAFTAHARAKVLTEALEGAPGAVAVELRVERLQDHLADGRTEMLDGVRWRWSDADAAAVEPTTLAALRALV